MPLNIDWQQILLHWMNLAILIGGLYFLLYKPVKDFMEKREAHYRELDRQAAGKLEEACFDTLNAGIMTKDLVGLVEPGFEARAVSSEEFLDAIAQRLAQKLA